MVRIDDSGDVTKCWLTRDEVSLLERAAGRRDWEREIAVELMGRVGLRAHEVLYPGDSELWYSDEGECWRVEVRGKNTKGGEPTVRDAWVPDEVEDDLRKFARERGRGTEESWVSLDSPPSVRRWVRQAAEKLVDDGHSKRWLQVSSHDLRRSWAQYHLVEKNRDVRTLMSIGGWSSYDAIEPYLREPSEGRIGEVMGSSGAPR